MMRIKYRRNHWFNIDNDYWMNNGYKRYGLWLDKEGFHIGWGVCDYKFYRD